MNNTMSLHYIWLSPWHKSFQGMIELFIRMLRKLERWFKRYLHLKVIIVNIGLISLLVG